ncbi:MAG: response regulator [Gammaproteobacteria bacterium]|nr:response regulator [Gammaproteobacteria bacterium]
MQRTVVIIEDEQKLASLLNDYLQRAGFRTHWLADGLEAVSWVRQNQPDLILLDLMLPGKDGIDICREVRGFSNVPIIMTTARVEEIDRLLGLELGADDYICKPYSPRETVARVKAILRRLDAFRHDKTVDADFQVDADTYQIHLNGKLLILTPVEFRLLSTLLAHPGRVYSRTRLLDHLYEDSRIVTDRTVDSHIKNLRKKIAEKLPDREIIKSIYSIGYKIDLCH